MKAVTRKFGDVLIDAYHQIISKLEFPKVVGEEHVTRSTGVIRNFEYALNKIEIVNLLERDLGLNTNDAKGVFEELKRCGFLIELPESLNQIDVDAFRTLHMDVLVRSAEIRTEWESIRYIVTPRISLYFIESPSESDRTILPSEQGGLMNRRLYNAIRNFFNDEKTANDFIKILREYLGSGLDGYQTYTLASMLEYRSKAHVITAPTGSGKTEIFLFYLLARLIKSKLDGKNPERVVLVYPRITLSVDQAERTIRLLWIANKYGYDLSFGLRDRETPRRGSKDEDGKPFRGLNCPVCHSQLVYDLESGSVRCDSCGEKFTFVKSTRSALGKENPDIIITNMWALETRMMDNNEYDLNVHSLLDVGIIVIDEAHEYKGLGGGLVSNLIKLLLSHSRRDTTVVISSATMPFAKDFASKLTGIPRDEIKEYNFHQIISELRNEIKIGGRRLVLIGIFDINPRFSWSTYCQLWAVSMAFLNHAYTVDDRQYVPQSIIFIDNIKELRRTYRGYEENISLGEPRDHLIGPKILGKSPHSLDSYSYWQYLSRNKRSEFLELFGKGGRLDELIERVAEVHSLIKEEERRKVIEALERGEKIGVIFSTSALELGVDYQNVSFILNVGLSDPLSLAQRVGRGGRSFNSLRTVLGIILTRNLPSETLLAHSPDVGRRLDPSAREYMEQIPVASDNPQVKKRGKIVECISSMARKGKRTYESGRGIREYAELQEFFSDLISEMRGAFS